MNSEYLKHAHSHMDLIDNGVPQGKQQQHLDMACVLSLMSIADSLVKLVDVFKPAEAE